MNFTQHALDKLERYEINPVDAENSKPLYQLHDQIQKTDINIIQISNIHLVLVTDPNTKNLITVYTTDQRTIDNRRKTKRWI
jgi:hypothetical protein